MDFNREPYFNDYDKSKNEMFVLFRPSVPVQTRELNKAQAIMFGQLESFANHIFKNGSKVSNARSSITEYDYVRLRGNGDLTRFAEGATVKGTASGLVARLVKVASQEDTDPDTIYVIYTNTAIDGVTSKFIPGEPIEFLDENSTVVYSTNVRCPSCPGSSETAEIYPTGKGHIFSIDEGIFWYEGKFITTTRQTIIVNKYSVESPEDSEYLDFKGAKIGFDLLEQIVTSDDDESLLDNALGYPNQTSPGADMYRVNLSLSVRSYDVADGEKFLLLGLINSRYETEFMKSGSEYSDIMDAMAQRLYETNGNFTVRPFKISFYEHKKKNKADPLGWVVGGSDNNAVALLTPSVGYVKGYRVEKINDTPVLIPKARDTNKSSRFIKRFDQRAFVQLRPTASLLWPNLPADNTMVGAAKVNIYSQADALGGIIGTCRFLDMRLVSGLNSDHSAIYEYAVTDVQMAAGQKFSDAKSFANGNAFFKAEIVTGADGTFSAKNANQNSLVYKIAKSNIKSLRDSDNGLNGSMSITVRKKLKATLDSNGEYTFNTGSNEFFEAVNAGTIVYVTNSSDVTQTFDVSSSIIVSSPTSLTVTLGASYSGQTLTVFQDVLKVSQKEDTKTLITSTITTNVAPPSTIGEKVYLGVVDALNIVKAEVFDHTDPAVPVFVEDVTKDYNINSGQTDYGYGESFVTCNRVMNGISGTYRLHLTYRHFSHSGTSGYFTVDSYSDVINDPANEFTYADIPVYETSTGEAIRLAEAIDFRRVLIGTDVSGTMPAPDTSAVFDCEYYLPRADLIQINKDGTMYLKTGTPGESPRLPNPDQDAMVLYHIFVNAYTYSMRDIKHKFIENKRYTMRDIGRLEDRIENLEYYTTLTLLEKQAKDMSIKDKDGFDRFKNGFIVDNFADFQAADLKSIEFKASHETKKRELRPSFKASNITLAANRANSVNVRWHGDIATLPYENVIASQNPYATKHVSVNHYLIYAKEGQLALSPNVDTWTDDTLLPEVVIEVDSGMEAISTIATASGALSTVWGSWSSQNSTVVSGNTATTTTTSTRVGTTTSLGREERSYTINDIVKDVQLQPYVRSGVIQLLATKLLPNTRMYVYYDGENVSEFARSISEPLTATNAADMLSSISWGSELYTDADGQLRAELNIPAGRFFAGKGNIRVSSDNRGKFDEQETCFAKATYYAGGLDITKQDTSLNIVVPTVEVSQAMQSTNNTFSVSTGPERIIEWDRMQPIQASPMGADPIAQAFEVSQDCFITRLNLYFQSIDMNGGKIWVELRTTENGYPTTIALARREFSPEQLTSSADSTGVMPVDFFVPVFVEAGTIYSFVVGGDSPNTRIWVAKLGEEVVDIPGKIVEEQPTLQSSFRSQNGATWNAEQFETVKYDLFCAEFTENQMHLELENVTDANAVMTLEPNPIETEGGSDMVRVYWPSHGFTEDDRIVLSMYDNLPLKIAPLNLPPQIGQFIHTPTGSGTIVDVVEGASATEYEVKLAKTSGRFIAGQNYTADATRMQIRDNYLAADIGLNLPTMDVINEAFGEILVDSSFGGYIDGLVNGIPVEEISQEHTVKAVDSIDSFIIQVTTPANYTGRAGGDLIKAYDYPTRYEMMNISGSIMTYSSDETWTVSTAAHGDNSSIFASEDYLEKPDQPFKPFTDYALEQPMKVASDVNERRVFGTSGQKSIKVKADFKAQTKYLSPVIDTSKFAATTVTYRVDYPEDAIRNVAPNADDRIVPETDPMNGSAVHKYVTVAASLKNAAADLMIYLDYYKDVNSDFEIYVKKLLQYGDLEMDETPWMKVNIADKVNVLNQDEKIEGEWKCSELVDGWNDSVTDEPIFFTGYKIKIVGYAKNTAKPSRFGNLRAIAVT